MNQDATQGDAVAGRPMTVGPERRGRRRRVARWVAGLVLLLVFALVGFWVFEYFNLSMGIKRSNILGGKGSAKGDMNILIMGLDSRLDENGNPLPKQIYDSLHAGDQQSGGLNANVLMLLHVPGDGSKATEISIPRDDYVQLAGCPDRECAGKIKQAYGLAFDQESRRLVGQTGLDSTQRQQKERDAGRKAEITAVSQFLGGVPIDHFVEVTLVSFYQIAQVVQPITVCVNADTQDSYSGANFHEGFQQIDATQALAFVRQRRDTIHPALNFTDLDRERRQQAFIASLAYQLKQADTFADPFKLTKILDVAKQNTAVDTRLDLLSLARQASNLTGGNVTFYTFPIDHFGTDPLGEDVNFVNLPVIQATVRHLLAPAATPATPHPRLSTTARSSPSASAPAPAKPVPAAGPGVAAPPPTALSAVSGGGIPCVK